MPCYAVLWELLSNATWTPPLAEVLSSIFLYIELPGLGQGFPRGNHFGSSLHRGILSRGPSVAVFNIKNHTVQEGICSICYCPTHGAVEKAILRTCVVLENVFFLEHVVGCRSAGRLGTARIHIHTMHTFDVLGCTRHCKEQHTYNAASERY